MLFWWSRYGRTQHCPFGASRRKDYSHTLDNSKNGPADVERWKRHGYGSTKQSEAETPHVINTVLQKWADPTLVRTPTAPGDDPVPPLNPSPCVCTQPASATRVPPPRLHAAAVWS